MTNEEAIEILKQRKVCMECVVEPSDCYKCIAAFNLAIKALETGEVYMTGEDYNLYMEGYKAGKRDFKPAQGKWIVTAGDNDGVHRICCPFCHYEKGSNNIDSIIVTFTDFPNFCEKCGADMRKGQINDNK